MYSEVAIYLMGLVADMGNVYGYHATQARWWEREVASLAICFPPSTQIASAEVLEHGL